jgi:polyphosphate kinase 2 (PPK2 family)
MARKSKKEKKNKKDKEITKPQADTEETPATEKSRKLSNKEFNAELKRLQGELVKLQYWVKEKGLRIIVVFEGRDAAGKGGIIKRITERVSPRVFRVVALPTPSEREKTQMYMQRYVTHFPAAGEIVLFDRSWYNRAGDGVLHRGTVPGVPALHACLREGHDGWRYPAGQVLARCRHERTGTPLQGPHP